MRAIISNHAMQRITERVACNKNKINKIVEKAWNSKGDNIGKEAKDEILKQREFTGREVFKYFQGYFFIFSIEPFFNSGEKVAVLVTVFKPNKHKKFSACY